MQKCYLQMPIGSLSPQCKSQYAASKGQKPVLLQCRQCGLPFILSKIFRMRLSNKLECQRGFILTLEFRQDFFETTMSHPNLIKLPPHPTPCCRTPPNLLSKSESHPIPPQNGSTQNTNTTYSKADFITTLIPHEVPTPNATHFLQQSHNHSHSYHQP